MAAAASGGSGTADLLLPPLPRSPPFGGSGTERALEEAAASGTLSLAGRRLRTFPVAAAKRWDLSDTTQADLSRNRFGEVPELTLRLVALEGLSLSHNCLRSLPPAISNLQALAHLDLSRNQLRSLPAGLCLLPLRVLNASNNRLGQLPGDIGALGTLRQLDVSCNQLQTLPPTLGQLKALRDLNLRRNQLTQLPPELADLPLVSLDFSCNRVAAIPRSFRRLRHLQILLTDNNPLQSPPAQVCLKGKVHIFKYLHLDPPPTPQPPPAGLTEEICPPWQRGGLDSGFNSVDSGSKRWSGNESTDEFTEGKHRERRSGIAGDSDPEQLDSMAEDEEPPPQEQQGLGSPRGDTPGRASGGRGFPLPRRRLRLWQKSHHADEAPPTPPKPRDAATKPAPRAPDELLAELRQSIESLLQLRLPEELGERLSSLLRPLLAPPTAPTLHSNTPDSIRRARPLQVKPPPPQPPAPPGLLAGFALFYGLLMALLFTAYRGLFGGGA